MAAATKTVCPVTRDQFRAKAEPIVVVFGDQKKVAMPKEFSTNSLGWNISDKMVVLIDGVPTTVQVGLNLTIVGSKELPKA